MHQAIRLQVASVHLMADLSTMIGGSGPVRLPTRNNSPLRTYPSRASAITISNAADQVARAPAEQVGLRWSFPTGSVIGP